MTTHFVGFRGNEYHSAVKAFGPPDFYHRSYDNRAIAEFCDGDLIIFANGYESKLTPYTYNDSACF